MDCTTDLEFARHTLAREVLLVRVDAGGMLAAGNAEDAIATLRQGIAAHPQAGPLYLILGVVHSRVGQHQEAVEIFQSIIDTGLNDDFLLHYNLAREYAALGNGEASQRHQVLYLQRIDSELRSRFN